MESFELGVVDFLRDVAELCDILEARCGSHVVGVEAKCARETRSGDGFNELVKVTMGPFSER